MQATEHNLKSSGQGLHALDHDDGQDCGLGEMFGGGGCEEEAAVADTEFELDWKEWLHLGNSVGDAAPQWPVSEPFNSVGGSTSRNDGEIDEVVDSLLHLHQSAAHHSLWGNQIWNAAKYFTKRIVERSLDVRGLSVLELGCGLGIPSIVAHRCGARISVATDYPDEKLHAILKKNVESNRRRAADSQDPSSSSRIPLSATLSGTPLLWGKKEHMDACLELVGSGCGFDVVILSDVVFNHVCHDDLLKTVAIMLAKDRRATAYCAFSHHRPHKMQEDLAFFTKAAQYGLRWRKIDEQVYPLMFPDDPGSPEVRAPVHCYALQQLYDDAGPPVDYAHEYDVVLQGTGVVETFLSAALSRSGLRVLHLDGEEHYGGSFNTLDPVSFVDFIQTHFDDVRVSVNRFADRASLPDDLRGPDSGFVIKKFLIDVIPLLHLSTGDLIRTLVDSECATNMEFQNVDRVVLLSPAADLSSRNAHTDSEITCASEAMPLSTMNSMPLTRAEIFASKDFSPMEMRRLMKFVKDVEVRIAEQEHAVVSTSSTEGGAGAASSAASPLVGSFVEGEQFPDFLKRKYQLSDKTVHLLTLFGLLQAPTLAESVALMRTFLLSVGRFGGRTPFLAPNYGSAELTQNMCRVSAVWGGMFILRRTIRRTWRDDKHAYVELSNGQHLRTKAVVCPRAARQHCDAANRSSDETGVNAHHYPQQPVRLARCVLVLNRVLLSWDTLAERLNDKAQDDDEASVRAAHPPTLVAVVGVEKREDVGSCGSADSRVAAIPVGSATRGTVHPVVVVQQTCTTMQVPHRSPYSIFHASADANHVSLDALQAVVDGLLVAHGASDDVLLRTAFVVSPDAPCAKGTTIIGDSTQTADGHPLADDHVFTVRTLFTGIDDGQYLREAKTTFERIAAFVHEHSSDPWSHCPHPDAASAAATTAAAERWTVPPFLPPPPEEVVQQTRPVDDYDDAEARLLSTVARAEPATTAQ